MARKTIRPGTEWSDVTPLAFISPPLPGGPLLSRPVGSPGVNSLVYAAVAPGDSAATAELYLMYDYLPRTLQTFTAGEFIADIKFPLTIQGVRSPDAVVQFRGALNPGAGSFFDVFVDLDGPGATRPVPAASVGIAEAAVGFGPSTLSLVPHMFIELEATLAIPANFSDPANGGAFPKDGTQGVYSPDPAFWGGEAANDQVDPPFSGAIFTINPDGSTLIIAAAPETTPGIVAAFGLLGVLSFHACRRGRRS